MNLWNYDIFIACLCLGEVSCENVGVEVSREKVEVEVSDVVVREG